MTALTGKPIFSYQQKRYRWCYGVISIIPRTEKHYLLADWDAPLLPSLDVEISADCQGAFRGIAIFKTPHGFHGVHAGKCYSLRQLVTVLHALNCDADYIAMTEKRGYATLEFKSALESSFFKDVPCCFVKFQRRLKLPAPFGETREEKP